MPAEWRKKIACRLISFAFFVNSFFCISCRRGSVNSSSLFAVEIPNWNWCRSFNFFQAPHFFSLQSTFSVSLSFIYYVYWRLAGKFAFLFQFKNAALVARWIEWKEKESKLSRPQAKISASQDYFIFILILSSASAEINRAIQFGEWKLNSSGAKNESRLKRCRVSIPGFLFLRSYFYFFIH